jgi:hypothetical protein
VLFCEGATKGSVQNITTLFFMGGGPARGTTSRRLGIISAYCHIMNYFCPKSFLIQFCTRATRNAHQENWGKIQGGPLGVWNPRTKTKPWFPPHLADIDGTAESDLDLGGGLGNSKKLKKWKNTAWSHGE